jgi:hypothetical protein
MLSIFPITTLGYQLKKGKGDSFSYIPLATVEAAPVLGYSDPYTPLIVIFLRNDWDKAFDNMLYLY